MDTDAAATWGVLNEVRRIREHAYRDQDERWHGQTGRTAAVAGLMMSGLGTLGLAAFPLALGQGRPDDPLTGWSWSCSRCWSRGSSSAADC